MSSMVDFMGVDAKSSTSLTSECLKKLEELSEDDVMQLTREDCRRYLKEKGMRRPSWNKAQALQQVLALRSLCHSSDAATKRGPPTPLAEELLPAKKPMTSVDLKSATVAAAPNSQLTMFYDGAVSIFDDVSPDKAYAIMLLAGNVKSWPSISVAAKPKPKIVIPSSELPQARKASLQRFLQRRREKIVKEASEKVALSDESSGKHTCEAAIPVDNPPVVAAAAQHPGETEVSS